MSRGQAHIAETIREHSKMVEEDREAVRAIIVEAATRGLRHRRSGSRRNPTYRRPSNAEAAWMHLYGTARAFVEWATNDNIALAISGLNERADSQAANIEAVRECAAKLAAIADNLEGT